MGREFYAASRGIFDFRERQMPHDPIIVKQDVIEKTGFGGHDMVVVHQHEAPAADDGGVAYDPYQEKNEEIAQTMMRWLLKHYAGYPWKTVADYAQGVVRFNIPILMENMWWAINLHTTDIVDGMRQGAGQILERYRLPRDRFHLGAFLEARAKHSKLIIPSRPVPE